MIALIIAWIFGATAFVNGCTKVLIYQGESVDTHERVATIQNDDQRALAAQAVENYFNTLNAARHRYFPLSVAGMLLGAVMVGFAARAMSGRESARSPLIQIVAVQAALVILTHFLMPDVRQAEAAADGAVTSAFWRDATQDPRILDALEKAMQNLPQLTHARDTALLIVRSLVSGFIVLALTRTRSRQFFEAADGRFSER